MIAMPRPPSTRGISVRLRVDPQAGLGHPADAGEAALAVRAVLQLDHQGLADGVLGRLLDSQDGDVALAP